MGFDSKELNSDAGNGFMPKTIAQFLQEISVVEDGKKLAKINGYVFELEQEMKKIHVFKRELPVCMLLLGDAIDRLKEEVVRCKKNKGKGLMIEEICPSTANCDGGDGRAEESIRDLGEKKKWMSSVQLWTIPAEHDNNNRDTVKFPDSSIFYQKRSQENRCGGCSEMEEDDFPGNGLSLSPPRATPAAARGRYGDGKSLQQQREVQKHQQQQPEQQQQPPPPPPQQERSQQHKKQRRSWSPDLHRRFVNALELLGGPKEATPKQIRELMQVADLTNDEVKSHLQKYRLHVQKMAGGSSENFDLNVEGVRSEKFKMTQSGSPDGPLSLFGSSKGISVSLTIGESFEDEEDAKSSHSWKGRAWSR